MFELQNCYYYWMKDWQKPKKWEFCVNRAYLPLSLSLTCFDTSKKYLDRILPVPEEEDIYAFYKNDLYYGVDGLKIFADTQIKLFEKQGPEFLWHMAKLCEKEGEKLIKSAEKFYSLDYAKKTNEQITEIFEDFCEQIKSFSVFLNYPWSLESFFDLEITKIISKYEKNDDKVLEWKKVLAEPIKLNDGQYEQLSLLKITQKIGSKEELEKVKGKIPAEITHHLEKYSWLQMRWLFGRPAKLENIIERAEHLFDEGDISEKISFFQNKSKKVEEATGDFVRTFKVEKNDAELIRIIKEYVFIRTYRSDIINHALFFMMPILEESAKRLSITYDDILYLSYQEILESLKRGTLLKDINISERKTMWALFREKDTLYILQGKEIAEFVEIQEFNKDYSESVKEITGQTGYKGKITGIVKTVITPDDVKKVSKGDILVAVMTFPSYIAAMEKASAFITDEGGILCHAAIVAREMNKPCIIGTKISTKVLKDGDEVEVDANIGIIKVLS